MQSVLQYRRFAKRLERQLEKDRQKPQGVEQQDKSYDTSLPGEQPDQAIDLEKANTAPLDFAARKSRASNQPIDVETYSEEDDEVHHDVRETDNLRKESIETEAEQDPNTLNQNGSTHLSRASTIKTQATTGTKLGLSMTGIEVRDTKVEEGSEKTRQFFVVGYEGDDDSMNPHNWSYFARIKATSLVAGIGAVVGVASSIDSSALKEASKEFGVSEVVESLATGLYLVGFGAGALAAGPISETIGRNPVYITTLTLYMIFIMASGLSPNIGAQLVFRFLAGFFGSTPLTCAGGSVADIWDPLERVFAFPVFANAAFMGPILGPVMGGFIAQSSLIEWRWTEWITLIMSGLVLGGVVLFQPETYAPILLKWKAAHLRQLTGDERYVSELEIRQESLPTRLKTALYRPFILTAQEPIIMLVALYLTVIYIILFTFLDGYDYIFAEIHGTSEGITGLCFVGIAIGLCISSAFVPLIFKWAKEELAKIKEQGGDRLPPEFRLWFAMLGGSPAIAISLFWMGWTSYPGISIWSPLAASALFGYGILSVFISSYQYIIDSYEVYAASALASVTLIRYAAAGGMVVVGIPFYENLGVHYTLTILACISSALVPVPYVFYKYGSIIRKRSKFAPTTDT